MTRYKLRGGRLQWVDLDAEVVALDEETLTYLGGNESAAVLWQELAAGATPERLAERLVEHFAVDAADAAADVDAFLTDLVERGLVERE